MAAALQGKLYFFFKDKGVTPHNRYVQIRMFGPFWWLRKATILFSKASAILRCLCRRLSSRVSHPKTQGGLAHFTPVSRKPTRLPIPSTSLTLNLKTF